MGGNKVESVYLYLSKIWRENKDGKKKKKKEERKKKNLVDGE